ncbi:MAG: hypothetical protein ACOC3I_03610 [Verrucomicrobiota bacterium]
MKSRPDPSLDSLLAAWQPSLPDERSVEEAVMARLRREDAGLASEAYASNLWWSRLGLAAAACLLLLLGAWGAVRWSQRPPSAHDLTAERASYHTLIDPVARVQAAASRGEEPAGDSLLSMLAWMQARFDLDQTQFLALVELHRRYEQPLNELYRELVALEQAYQHYERQRSADRPVDFIAVYELLTEREALRGSARETSGALVSEVLAVLRPFQRGEYLAMLEEIAPPSPHHAG